MYRRTFNILGLALLLTTTIAAPAEGATCPELGLFPTVGGKTGGGKYEWTAGRLVQRRAGRR